MKPHPKSQLQIFLPIAVRMPWCALLTLIGLVTSLNVQAANSTWTNAPVSIAWTNVLNWNSKVVPGTINNTGNNGTDTSSIATFTNPIPGSLIGGATAAIVPDDATIANGKARMLSQLNFDGPNCGAYVFSNSSPFAPQTATTPETGVLSLCIPSSTITTCGSFIGAQVVNPQIFMVPVQIRLPSSTTGIYGFTNNATSPLATYYFNTLFLYPGATSRGCTFLFDGSNTGTNTVAYLSQSTNTGFTATCSIIKNGTGRWILSGTNNFKATSTVAINGGTLEVQNTNVFGLTTSVTVGAKLQIDGVTLSQSSLTLANGGNINAVGSLAVNGVAVGTSLGLNGTLSTTSASDVLTNGNAANKMTGGLVDSTVHVAGPGTVQLAFDANYIGKWSVDAGTLQLMTASGLGTGANVNVGAGAILNVTNLGASWNPSTTGIGGSGTGTGGTAATLIADAAGTIDLATGTKAVNLTFTPTGFSGDSTHPALYVSQGTLSMGGNAFSINNAGGTALGNGTYTLIKQASGTITSAGGYSVVGVTGSGVVGGSVASIVVTGSEVDLVVAPYVAKNLVWSGTGSAWDIAGTSDWLNGVSASVFNNSDNVTFNSVGAANPSVTLAGTISPGSVTVSNISPLTYTLSSGQIAGGASLTKAGSGTLVLNQANTYSGGTVVSNGVLQLGIANAIPSIGAGNVSVVSPGILDLNAVNESLNGLNGSGTVDTVSGGAPVLTVGNNDASGTFSGVIQNTGSGSTLALTKVGLGTETLSGANTYAGATTVSGGTLAVGNPNALGSGGSAVTVNTACTLALNTNAVIATLAGTGAVANNSANPTLLTVTNGGTFNGVINDGTGAMSVYVAANTLRLNGTSGYTGGTRVGAGATLAVGQNPGQAGTGGIIASNGATVASASTGGTASQIINDITTVPGATVNFTGGGAGADGFSGQFIGDATTTNVYRGQLTINGNVQPQFTNFLGVVQFFTNTTAGTRINQTSTTYVGGGDNTTFDFHGGFLFNRNPTTFSLGAIIGGINGGGISGPTTPTSTFWIGAKGINTEFFGTIAGSNNIVKVGAGSLTLSGAPYTLNTDNATYTNILYSGPAINYLGNTTISNGVLALSVPNNLNNSPAITLAGAGAVLDAANMGYISNYTDPLTGSASLLVTNGVFELLATTPGGSIQSLNGIGTLRGSLLADAGSVLNPGNVTGNIATGTDTGILTVTNKVDLESVALNIQFNRGNAVTSDEISAGGSIIVTNGTLTVTNVGSDLVTGDVFHLFNKGIIGTGFTTISLPVSNVVNTIKYSYETNLFTAGTSPAGSIKVLVGASAMANYSTNITATVTGGGTIIDVSWPVTHLGWELMVQTNTLANGLGNNWVTNYGTAAVTSTNYPINPANGSVFFKLVHP